MEAELKTQAAIAVAMLRSAARSSTAIDYIKDARHVVQDVDYVMVSQGRPDAVLVEQLASVHSIGLASREVAELETSVQAAIVVLSRWLEHRQTGLSVEVAMWRLRADELVGAVTRAGKSLEQAAASRYSASAVLDVATVAWADLPPDLRTAWVADGRRFLLSTRDHLNNAYSSLNETCAAADRARDAAKFLIDLL